MNENLQTTLAELINKSIAGTEGAANFLQAEIPDVIHQLLLWRAVYGLIEFLLGIIILCGYVWVGWYIFTVWLNTEVPGKCRDSEPRPRSDEYEPLMVALFYGGVGVIMFFVVQLSLLNLTWLQIWAAPKVWLIEYAVKLIK